MYLPLGIYARAQRLWIEIENGRRVVVARCLGLRLYEGITLRSTDVVTHNNKHGRHLMTSRALSTANPMLDYTMYRVDPWQLTHESWVMTDELMRRESWVFIHGWWMTGYRGPDNGDGGRQRDVLAPQLFSLYPFFWTFLKCPTTWN